MLSYWILKRPDGRAVGFVRAHNDRAALTLTGEIAGSFTLFSETAAVPIVPGTETVLPGAIAVLGAEGERVTGFAAAPNAAPLTVYRNRLSQICTKAKPAPQSSPVREDASIISQNNTIEAEELSRNETEPEDISQNNTKEADSVTETARETEEFSLLLQHADAFFAAYEGDTAEGSKERMVQKTDNMTEPDPGGIDLFSQEYPGARWRYVEGTDVLPHYEGTWRQPNGQTMHILAVRGRAAPRPPRALLGFTRFLRDADGNGYWLRLTPLSKDF